MTSSASCLPPPELQARVGSPGGAEEYDRVGASCRDEIIGSLPADWNWSGKRVLDFGCGVGRTLRHFSAQAEAAEFWGCDVHPPSIAWLETHADFPLCCFVNRPEPHLDLPSGHFDLIYALSVFTHIDEDWAAWLLELRRVLAADGLLIATFLGPGMATIISGRPWDESTTGMNVHSYGSVHGGFHLPNVLHSPWWLRAHWGRAFEIVSLRDRGFGAAPGSDGEASHGWVLMRKAPGEITRKELEAPEPDEPRELLAALQARAVAGREARDLALALAASRGG